MTTSAAEEPPPTQQEIIDFVNAQIKSAWQYLGAGSTVAARIACFNAQCCYHWWYDALDKTAPRRSLTMRLRYLVKAIDWHTDFREKAA